MEVDATAFQMTREELLAELGRRSSHFKESGSAPAARAGPKGRLIVNVGRHADISSPLLYPGILIGFESIEASFYLLEVLAILIDLGHRAEARTLAAFIFKGVYFNDNDAREGKKWVAHYFPELAEFKGEFNWLSAQQQSNSFYEQVEVWPAFILIPAN